MFKNSRQFLIRCLSPMHAGTGQDIGSIDMPIQRESFTDIPKVEASTFRGALRSTFSTPDEKDLANMMFGENNDENGAGIIGFTDLKLLFYPIKSRDGVYKLVTCPFLLKRYFEDKNLVYGSVEAKIDYINSDFGIELEYQNDKLVKSPEAKISLDDYSFQMQSLTEDLTTINDIDIILKRINPENRKKIVILNDEDFMELEELNREIITRNKIDQDTGVVEDGALFTEEYLPAESILYGILLYSPFKQEKIVFLEEEVKNKEYSVQKNLKNKRYFQIGGNSNLGKGIVKMEILFNGGDC